MGDLEVTHRNAIYYLEMQSCDVNQPFLVGQSTDCHGWTNPAKIWTGPYEVYGAILDEYEATGLMNGPLGQPTSSEGPAGKQKGRFNFFENGAIFWRTGDTFAHVVYGDIFQTWTSLDRENGWLGFP